MTEVKCIWGRSTEQPCPRPGTGKPEHAPETMRLCEVHAALQPLRDELLDLGLAEEKLEELEEYAQEWCNRPLLAILERVRAEVRERTEFIEEQHKAISIAGS